MTMKITTILCPCLINGLSYSPSQRVAFSDDEADDMAQEGLAQLTPDATGFTDHDSNLAAARTNA
jgi:hypothetical protein